MKAVNVHEMFFEELRVNTLVMQFFGYFVLGRMTEVEREEFIEVESKAVELLTKLRNPLEWDGKYDIVFLCSQQVNNLIGKFKKQLARYSQKVSDDVIADYVIKNRELFQTGISLQKLDKLLDVSLLFRNGHFLHEQYFGYANSWQEAFKNVHSDYLNAAISFYNDGYDLFYKRKEIKLPSQDEVLNFPRHEAKRFYTHDEITRRNFREAFINLILFVESFINSVGYDAYLKGNFKNSEEEANLKGLTPIKNGYPKFSSLRKKITDISRIISGRVNSTIDLDKSPFKNYLDIHVRLRNDYVHASPGKKIFFTIQDWKNKCDELIDNYCFQVIDEFWRNCYPSVRFPNNLFNDYYSSSFKNRQSRATQAIP